MPALAQGIKRPGLLSTPYEGKRALAKRDIGIRLVRMGVTLDSITDEQAAVLNPAATYKELALIFNDMADRNDTVSADKAKKYEDLFDDAWTDIALALGITSDSAGITSIPCYRA
ncbi:MAG: hypothetical protein J0H49_10680 [Acidobacteria bacterium]|nr:hypothetical protein [Acidobacteriota bacterium]